jgi:hypothetical protein
MKYLGLAPVLSWLGIAPAAADVSDVDTVSVRHRIVASFAPYPPLAPELPPLIVPQIIEPTPEMQEIYDRVGFTLDQQQRLALVTACIDQKRSLRAVIGDHEECVVYDPSKAPK